jgi:hypothetical protein
MRASGATPSEICATQTRRLVLFCALRTWGHFSCEEKAIDIARGIACAKLARTLK